MVQNFLLIFFFLLNGFIQVCLLFCRINLFWRILLCSNMFLSNNISFEYFFNEYLLICRIICLSNILLSITNFSQFYRIYFFVEHFLFEHYFCRTLFCSNIFNFEYSIVEYLFVEYKFSPFWQIMLCSNILFVEFIFAEYFFVHKFVDRIFLLSNIRSFLHLYPILFYYNFFFSNIWFIFPHFCRTFFPSDNLCRNTIKNTEKKYVATLVPRFYHYVYVKYFWYW